MEEHFGDSYWCKNALYLRLPAEPHVLKGVTSLMVRLNTPGNELDEDAIPTTRWSRWVAPLCLLGIFILSELPGEGVYTLGLRFLGAIVLLVLSIVWGVLARQLFLVSFVVAGIVIGVTILLPGLLRPRTLGSESAAIANLRTINTAEVTYLSGSGGTYGTMTNLIAVQLLDDTFIGTKAGYNYTITLDATGSSYTAEAVPASTMNGRYGYYSVPDAIVRYSTDASLAPAGQSGRNVQ